MEPGNPEISITRQCELLGLGRSAIYYQARPENIEDLEVMRLLDEQYTETPFYGYRRMTIYLQRLGWVINHKRVFRLMKKLGLEAIYPKPNLSKPNKEHLIYPYLLRGVKIEYVDQVWSTDITYIRLGGGFVYLMVIMDWYSRYVIEVEVSNTLESAVFVETLKRAVKGGKPEIFNSDQGSQFTATEWTKVLLENEIQISMDGRGRCFDNIFVERLWRSVKPRRSLSERIRRCMGSGGSATKILRVLQSPTAASVARLQNAGRDLLVRQKGTAVMREYTESYGNAAHVENSKQFSAGRLEKPKAAFPHSHSFGC